MIQLIVVYTILLSAIFLASQIFRRPAIATTLVWGMITMEAILQQRIEFFLIYGSFINFAVAGVVGVAAAWTIMSGKYIGVGFPIQFWLYLSLMIFAGLTYFWSISQEDTEYQLIKEFPYVIAFGFLAPMCVYDEKQLDAAIKTLIYFGSLVVVGILVSESGKRGILLGMSQGQEVTGNPLAAASFSAYVAFASLFSMFGKRLFSPGTLLKTIIIIMCAASMVQSGSRGQLIAFCLVSILFFPIMVKAAAKRSVILSIIAAIFLSTIAIMLVDYLGFSKRWDFQVLLEDQRGRFEMLQYLLTQNYQEGPAAWVFGLGNSISYMYFKGYCHNTIGETFAEEGLIGLVLLLTLLFFSLKHGYQMMKLETLSRRTRVNVATIVAMFTFTIILSFKEGSLLTSSISMFSMAMTIGWLTPRLLKKKEPMMMMLSESDLSKIAQSQPRARR